MPYHAKVYGPYHAKVYGMPVIPYRGYFVGLPWILHPARVPDATRPTAARAGRGAAYAWLYLDYACTALFVVEALAKGVGHGVAFPPWPCATRRAVRSEQFLSSATEVNDAFVIVASLAGYAVARSAGGGGYDVRRTLRLLGSCSHKSGHRTLQCRAMPYMQFTCQPLGHKGVL